jgi:serine/threonine-protein kinase HipA
MIRIWADHRSAGLLGRELGNAENGASTGSTFVYEPGVDAERAVSMTMPVRLASWSTAHGVPPIFEMNLPEGPLRERLQMTFSQPNGRFDDLDLLAIVGRSQMGRIRVSGHDDDLDEGVPFQSVNEIVRGRPGGELYRDLVEKFTVHSGISGIQPKLLVRDEGALSDLAGGKRTLPASFRGATHIVKFWDSGEFQELAANEFFCLKAAERCGLQVSPHRLAEDGSALVTERFDLGADGKYRGFEDFCVLNARRTEEKYRGSYEAGVMRRFQQFARSGELLAESLQLFTLIALNCAIRNGDAHLKNFGIVYDAFEGDAHLAPVYDLVTTTVYLPHDRMALTLNGKNEWPTGKELILFGEKRSIGTRQAVLEIFERIADALSETTREIKAYGQERPAFAPIGSRMMEQWEVGRRECLMAV